MVLFPIAMNTTSGKHAYAVYLIDLHGKERKFQGNFLLIR